MYTLCLRMVGERRAAEDLTQEVFLQLFRKIHTFRGESAFSTWLHRLAVNVVLMRLRKKLPPEDPLEEMNSSEEPTKSNDVLGTVDLALAGALDRLNLERAIAELPRGYRVVFVLHDVEGFGHAEIARMLDVTTGASKSQLHKARFRLRQLLRTGVGQLHTAGGGSLPPRVLKKRSRGRRPSCCMELVWG